MEIISNSVIETQQLATRIGALLWPNSCVLLAGDLGSGKTCFTQGLGYGLGINRVINSPTFTILKVYEEGRLPLYHLDAYRLEDIKQDLGFDELLNDEAVVVVEWPEYLKSLLPGEYLLVNLQWLSESDRRIVISASGDRYQKLLEQLC